MAITSAVCTSFKVELLKAVHNFSASGGNTFKIALYTSSASLGAATTAFSTSNEISNTSGSAYSSGGATLTNIDPAAVSTTAVCVIAFGADKTVTSGTFTIQFPAADASNAIIRLA